MRNRWLKAVDSAVDCNSTRSENPLLNEQVLVSTQSFLLHSFVALHARSICSRRFCPIGKERTESTVILPQLTFCQSRCFQERNPRGQRKTTVYHLEQFSLSVSCYMHKETFIGKRAKRNAKRTQDMTEYALCSCVHVTSPPSLPLSPSPEPKNPDDDVTSIPCPLKPRTQGDSLQCIRRHIDPRPTSPLRESHPSHCDQLIACKYGRPCDRFRRPIEKQNRGIEKFSTFNYRVDIIDHSVSVLIRSCKTIQVQSQRK